MLDLTLVVAFSAGLVSFLAPCVLPLVPGFLAYLGGMSLNKNTSPLQRRFATFYASIFFVLGFTLVFALLGLLLHGAFMQVGATLRISVARLGGAVMVFFGLYLMGLVKLSFFERPRRIAVHKKFSSRALASFVFGAAFAAGWTPCVGAALGAILGLSALAPAKALALLVAYALGLGVPFLVIGFFAGRFETYLSRNFFWTPYVNILFGGVLVFLGLLAFTQNLATCREVLWNFAF